MGNSMIAKTKRQMKSDLFQWETILTSSYYTNVIDRNNGIQAEKYMVDAYLVEQQWPIYVLRKNNSKYLVAIYDIIPQEQKSICANTHEASVIVECVPYRLSDLGTISFEEGIYVIQAVFEGYKVLKENNIDFYLLDQTNVCFNMEGICKFWINQNIYLPKPQFNRIVSEQNFIKAFLEVVEQRMDHINSKYLKAKSIAEKDYSLQYFESLLKKFSNPNIQSISSISTSKPKNNQIKIPKTFNNGSGNTIEHKKISISKNKLATTTNREDLNNHMNTIRFNCNPQKNGFYQKFSLAVKIQNTNKTLNSKLQKTNNNQQSYQQKQMFLSPTKFTKSFSSKRLSSNNQTISCRTPNQHGQKYRN